MPILIGRAKNPYYMDFWHCHMTVPFTIQKNNQYRSSLMVILLCVLKYVIKPYLTYLKLFIVISVRNIIDNFLGEISS